jgi:hypothetical protein
VTAWEQTGGDDAARGAEMLENGLVGLVGQCDGQDARRQPSCDVRGWVGLWGPEAGHWFPPARETREVETQTTDQARTAPSEEGAAKMGKPRPTGYLSLSLCRPRPIRAALYLRVRPKAGNLFLRLEEQQKEWARRTGSSLKKCSIS